jgi:hypothetical protein
MSAPLAGVRVVDLTTARELGYSTTDIDAPLEAKALIANSE